MNDPTPFPQDSPFPPDFPTSQGGSYGSAPGLVKAVAIANLILGAVDILYMILLGFYVVMFGTGVITEKMIREQMQDRGGPMPPMAVIITILSIFGVLSLAAAILKVTAGIKLLRRGSMAWGLGLAAGIVGSLQLWCLYGCVLPLAVGVFTIVVMCLQNTRNYLSQPVNAS